MLPDLPELKQDLDTLVSEYLRAEVRRRMPGIGEVPQHLIHEGERMRIVRADGSVEDSQLKEASSEMLLRMDEVVEFTPETLKAKLDAIAEDMARQISQHAFTSINSTLEASGRVVDNGGRPLDAESILNALETIQIDFDASGRPNKISFIVGPAIADQAKQEFQRLMSDPTLRQRYDALIQKKRLEWRDREATRKLVG